MIRVSGLPRCQCSKPRTAALLCTFRHFERNQMAEAFVLLSGGIDSTVCLYMAITEYDTVHGISLFYGQRHRKEIEYAAASCERLNVPHHVIELPGIIPQTLLTDPTQEVPKISYAEITGVSPAYVPFRNGLLLSATTSFVVGQREKMEAQDEWAIYFGAHAEDAQNWAYPDCTPEFIGAMANAIHVGTYRGVRLRTPLEWLNKADIINLGESLHVDWRKTWSCYAGGKRHCGACPTCQARRMGFIAAEVADPTEYAEQISSDEGITL